VGGFQSGCLRRAGTKREGNSERANKDRQLRQIGEVFMQSEGW